jgi:hypothetical protein
MAEIFRDIVGPANTMAINKWVKDAKMAIENKVLKHTSKCWKFRRERWSLVTVLLLNWHRSHGKRWLRTGIMKDLKLIRFAWIWTEESHESNQII